MSVHVLVLLLVFKGIQYGRSAKQEIPTLPPVCVYAMQKKVWMDRFMMMVWIEKCLSPWKDTLPPDVIPLLTLNSFCVHMMGVYC